jgi:hypothetical protein
MSFHRNAKLGLAGRFALVSSIESGMTLKAAAAAFSVVAGNRAQLVASLAAGKRGSPRLAGMPVRSGRPDR